MKKVLLFLTLLFTIAFAIFAISWQKPTLNTTKPTQNVKKVVVGSPKPTQVTNTYLPISLNSIFAKNNTTISNQNVLLATTGDFMPGRTVNYISQTNNDFLWTTNDVKSIFNQTDITLVNLESPLIANCPLTNSGFKFCGNLKHTESLKQINTKVVNLANNHAFNYGEEGFKQTVKTLNNSNIKVTGTNKNLVIIEKKGIKIAFLGYNDVGFTPNYIASASIENFKKDIPLALSLSDFVVVSIHFGQEYTTSVTQRQKDLSKQAINLGASLVVGNHPHIIQPVEVYKQGVIVYAHGNFVFDQEWAQYTKEGVVGFFEFNKDNGLVNTYFKPIFIKNYGQATIGSEQIVDNLYNLSKKFSTIN